jgi:hypothetical protein
VRLVREHGLMEAKAMVTTDAAVRGWGMQQGAHAARRRAATHPPHAAACMQRVSSGAWASTAPAHHPRRPVLYARTSPPHPQVLFPPRSDDLALFQASLPDGGSRRARDSAPVEASAALDALKRSPLMLDLPATHTGVESIAGMVGAAPLGSGDPSRPARGVLLLLVPRTYYRWDAPLLPPAAWLFASQPLSPNCPRPARRSDHRHRRVPGPRARPAGRQIHGQL